MESKQESCYYYCHPMYCLLLFAVCHYLDSLFCFATICCIFFLASLLTKRHEVDFNEHFLKKATGDVMLSARLSKFHCASAA